MYAFWLLDDGKWTEDVAAKMLSELTNQLSTKAHYVIEAQTNGGYRFGVTHAGYLPKRWFEPQGHNDENYYRRLIWSREQAEMPTELAAVVTNIDYTVHGHTIFKKPTKKANALFIDTGCVCGGALTAIDLEQFAQAGEFNADNTFSA
jgi:hypothetical protein